MPVSSPLTSALTYSVALVVSDKTLAGSRGSEMSLLTRGPQSSQPVAVQL